MSRAIEIELENAIINIMKKRPNRSMTRREICRELGRSKNPSMIAIIENMVQQGKLRRTVDLTVGQKKAYFYSLPS